MQVELSYIAIDLIETHRIETLVPNMRDLLCLSLSTWAGCESKSLPMKPGNSAAPLWSPGWHLIAQPSDVSNVLPFFGEGGRI